MTVVMKILNRRLLENARVRPATPSHRQLLVLLCVSVPSFMINLDANIVAVSLPSIARTLNADFAATEWVISAYTLAFASLLLPAGALADIVDRRRLLIAIQVYLLIVAGTLGVLALAARRGFVDLADSFARLKRTNFRYRQGIMDALLDQQASK